MPHEHSTIMPKDLFHEDVLDMNHLATSFYTWTERENIVGASFAVVNQNEVLLSCTHGVQNLSTKETISNQTLFPIASLTKHIGSVLLCLMEEDGYLNLDDPIQKHLPHVQIGPKDLWEKIKCVDLLTHSIGLCSKDQPSKDMLEERGMEAVFDYLKNAVPTKPYHTVYDYVNVPYALIPLLIEKFYGMDVEAFAQERLFFPLEMKQSTFLRSFTPQGATCYAKEYSRSEGILEKEWTGTWNEDALPYLPMYALAGGLMSSTDDMSKWLQWHLRGSLSFSTKECASKGLLTTMLRQGFLKEKPSFDVIRKLYTPHIRIDPIPQYDVAMRSAHEYGLRDYGLGLKLAFLSAFEPLPFSTHNEEVLPLFCMHEGSLRNARSTLLICPRHNLAAIMLTNCGGQDASSNVMFAMMDAIISFEKLSPLPLKTK